MKLSVKRQLGCTHVRGGRVLTASIEHSVSTSSYDPRPDDTTGKRRKMPPWVTVRAGDIAVEIVAVKTSRVLGYMYASGDAINVIRYVGDSDRALVAGWFATGKALRFEIALETPEQTVASMMAIKYSGADIAVSQCRASSEDLRRIMDILARAYSYCDDARTPTTDVVITVHAIGGRDRGAVHFQTPARAQDWPCQPFVTDLFWSSPEAMHHDFLVPAT
jgi:hypothetical protein